MVRKKTAQLKSATKAKNKSDKNSSGKASNTKADAKLPEKIDNAWYEKELATLQIELVKLQESIKDQGLKVVVVFEGRDATGKGGVINKITGSLSPRICRVVALPRPTSAKSPNGTSKDMCRLYPPQVKWACLTEAGTTGPVLSG